MTGLPAVVIATLSTSTPSKGPVHFETGDRAGEPSRWNTLRALRVLRWASAC